MLLCTVRDCRLPLERGDRKWACARRHSFDVARSGYVNLLQPQDKRSKQPGDSVEAVAARRRLHDRGMTRPLLEGIAGFVRAQSSDVVLDAGCGDGFYLGEMAAESGFDAHGIDISIPAVDAAARRYPECEWVVANADRFVPYADESFSLVMSITARMNAPEFSRVLRSDGRLLVAVAAADDLVELRGRGRDRVERTVADFSSSFRVAEQARITTHAELDAEGTEDVLLAIYRPLRARPFGAMKITLSLDLILFQKLSSLI
jgi:23S rRNA (guanine745-N1)-methyltransferase